MVSNEQGWLLRLLVALLCSHTSHCQEGNTKPSCTTDHLDFHCRHVKSFAFITPLLPTQPPGITMFRLTDSPDFQLTSTDFNHSAFQNTRELELLRCDVPTINPELFTSLPRLTMLSILSNILTEITSSSFLGLERLESIALHDNQIASVAADTFTNLSNLTTVYFSNNSLAFLTDNMFKNQRKMRHMYFAHSEIAVLNDNTFEGLVKLQHLNLRYNRIESISPGAFTVLTELTTLYLGYNKLQSISPELFQTNTRLKDLDLSGNNLANLANYPLNIPSLIEVTLNDGKIQSIPVDYFANLKNVSTLSLISNELSRFEDVSIEGLPELQYLYLDSNKFTSFKMTAFRELYPDFAAIKVGSFKVLRFENNPWDCSEPVVEDMVKLCRGRGFEFWR